MDSITNTSHAIKHAASLLKAGKIVAVPTETVYGLGGDARSPAAIQKIYDIKTRPATNPLIIHLATASAIEEWATHIPKVAWKLAKQFWPGPLTLVLEKQLDVLDSVTANQPTVALRVPNHPLTLALLDILASGIAAPSANRSGRISPTTAEHVRKELGSKVDYILEGGPCQIGLESTIVSLLESDIQILRPGKITQQDILSCLGPGAVVHIAPSVYSHALASTLHPSTQQASNTPTMPGSSLSHYAPEHPLFLCDYSEIEKHIQNLNANTTSVAVVSFSEKPNALLESVLGTSATERVFWIQMSRDADQYAQALYDALRTLDMHNPTCILVQTPPQQSEWLAVFDRLYRASHKNE